MSALNAEVLVLNKAWSPVHVTSARRAFALLLREMAEVIDVNDGAYTGHDFESWAALSRSREHFTTHPHDWVRTVRMHLAVPKVIRLLGYNRLPRQGVKLNRRNIFARDRNQCQYCGQHFSTSELSLDHVKPRSQGGENSWINLVCCCTGCNARKGGRTPTQSRMHLIREPVKPKRNPAVSLRLSSDKYASWRAFLDHAYWSVELK